MKIHRSAPAGDFAIIPNETLRDERLSFAARGHLAYLLSRPDDWKTSADDEAERARGLRAKRGEGREAMRRVYKELKDAGYMHLVRSADASGRWTTETHVYDRAQTEVRPADVPESRTSASPAETTSPQVTPTYGKPGVGSPGVGSPDRRFTRTSRTKTDYEDQDQPPDQSQDQEQPIAKLQDRQFPDGPGTVADDARQLPPDTSESPATDRNARARKPAA